MPIDDDARPIWNVFYDTPEGTRTYLSVPVDKQTAMIWARKCKAQYVGKPYPNGKGYYPVSRVRVQRED